MFDISMILLSNRKYNDIKPKSFCFTIGLMYYVVYFEKRNICHQIQCKSSMGFQVEKYQSLVV